MADSVNEQDDGAGQTLEKKCYRCRAMKSLSDFTARIDDRYYEMCRSCVSDILQKRARGKTRLNHSDVDRVCYLCQRRLPNAAFTRRTSGTYYSACKECNRHVFAHRRRARIAGSDGSYTQAEWQALVAQHRCCPMCRRDWGSIPPRASGDVITADHIVPIAKGGANTISNIQPLCYSCNSKKGVKLL